MRGRQWRLTNIHHGTSLRAGAPSPLPRSSSSPRDTLTIDEMCSAAPLALDTPWPGAAWLPAPPIKGHTHELHCQQLASAPHEDATLLECSQHPRASRSTARAGFSPGAVSGTALGSKPTQQQQPSTIRRLRPVRWRGRFIIGVTCTHTRAFPCAHHPPSPGVPRGGPRPRHQAQQRTG